MSRYCLDTSAYSQFKRGRREIVDLIDRAEWIGLPAVALGELRVGFLLGGRRKANETELDAFLANPAVKPLDVDPEVSLHYAEIVVDLRRAGTPIPTNDIWIAATAARHGAIVLTTDAHYDAIGRVGSIVVSDE
ncbi:MAG: type II toxin-antitoxin system VapC family toxin [Chloroflexi bacterium]|nr:type II toxin-antitoxin system VapC family toxin [Chloroflexota bacterium]